MLFDEELQHGFQSERESYFKEYRITAEEYLNGQFWIACVDKKSNSRLFCSETGHVWNPVNIDSRFSVVSSRDYGPIIRILQLEKNGDMCLVSQNGYLITVPDCAKCVRARKISDQKLTDACLEKGMIRVKDENENEICFYAEITAQYRCVMSFARPHINTDGIIVDLRRESDAEKNPVPGACKLSGDGRDQLEKLIRLYPKNRYLFFLCSSGSSADTAAREARQNGIRRAYSMGELELVL